jgi:hypothetical protein
VCISKGWVWMSTHKKMMIPRRSKDYWATEIVSHNTHTSVVKLWPCNFPFTLDIQTRCTWNCRTDTRLRRWSRVRTFQEDVFEATKIANFLRLVLWTYRETLSFCCLEDGIWHGLKLLWLLMQDWVLVWSRSHYVHHADCF